MALTDRVDNQQEIEWQFDVDDLGVVESWLRARAEARDLQFHFDEPKEHVDSYYDTPDWRLFRAGYVLRLRQAEGEPAEATLKSFGTRKDGLRRRREINERLNFDGIASDPTSRVIRAPGPVGQRVKAALGKRAAHALRRLFDAHTRRRRIGVYQDGARLAEIALDDVSIAADRRRRPVCFRRVEVEVSPDGASGRAPDAVEAFVAEMRAANHLRPAADSKFELGLRAQQLQPGFALDLGRPEDTDHLDDDPTIGELAYAVLREHFAQFLLHEPGVRLGEDPEAVHRARVATRRLRAALSLFRDYLPPEAQRLRDELRWIARLLGGVRDLDVQLERLATWREEDATLEPCALDSLEALLAHQRDQTRAKLLRGLNSARYERLVAEFTGFLRSGTGVEAGEQCAQPARKEMPGLIRRRYDKVRALGDDIAEDSSPSEYHELRIRCKRLRYALEFAEPLYGKVIRSYLPRLIALQDLLGLHQDAHVAIEQMRRLSLSPQHELPAQTIFALGEIAQRYAQQAEALRAEFPKVYRRIKGKAWEKLQRALA
ncbi:MAG: CHAD domain-containing protein [Anaerolineae bacterium]|nr:CHAD domain-containing protein [Candidatus Roseilinea sp.]MDW8451825.1 CHAD domain-containing protein [Anaerolineae bacterium]